MPDIKTTRSKLRRLKLRRLRLRRLAMKTKTPNRISRNLTSVLILLALVAATVVPVLAQSKRKTTTRRRASARKVVKPVTPPVVYYNVNAGQIIRVRMNQNITSETARVGDQFTTTVVDPIYANGVEVIPAGS